MLTLFKCNLFVLFLALIVMGTVNLCAAYGEGGNPPAPQLVSPSDGTLVTIDSLTLTWNAISHANSYDVSYISETDKNQGLDLWAAFMSPLSQNLQGTEYTIPKEYLRDVLVYNILYDDTFYWKVIANVDSDYYWPESWSPYSEIWSFNVLKWPAARVDNTYWGAWTSDNSLETIDYQTYLDLSYGGGPSPGYWELDIIPITISHTAHLSWTDRSTDQQQKPVNFADRYRVQLSTSSTFESLIVDAITENTSYTTSELSPNAYYWRVRSETNDGLVTEWNTPRKFVIASGAAINENIASVSILSPASGATVSDDLQITGSCNDSDGTVEYVQIKIDSGTWIKVSGTISWSYDLDTTELENGLHTLYARAWDGESYSPIKSVSLTVDNIEIDNSTGNSGGTPGFELVIVVCAIALVFLWKRKRT